MRALWLGLVPSMLAAQVIPPELPRAVPSIPAAVLARPCTKRPTTVAAIQTALNAGGSHVICLPMGLALRGNLHINGRIAGDTAWTVLRADTALTLGVRLTGAERLPKITAAAIGQPSLFIHRLTSKWIIQGLELTTDSTPTTGGNYAIYVGEYVNISNPLRVPRDIHFTHVNVHGWLHQDLLRGFTIHGANVTVRDSRCTEIHGRNAESQCVLAYNGPGPYLIENNLLEAASENIMWGGGDPGVPGLVPCDITIRGNLIRKPTTWKVYPYNVKLLLEAKNACRMLVEGNRFDGVWTQGQTGFAVALKSVNQEGRCRWCRVTDVTIRGNTFVNVGAGFQFAGRPEMHPVDTALSRVLVTGNWIDSVNMGPFVGEARPLKLLAQANDIAFTRNTFTDRGTYNRDAVVFDIGGLKPAVTRFQFDDNVLPIAQYGVGATAVGQGTAALNAAVAGGWSFARNAFIGAPRTNYPATTQWASALAPALALGAGAPSRPVP